MVGLPAWSQTAAARIPHRPPGVRLWWYRCPPGMPGLGSPRAGSRPPGRAGGLPSPELHPLGSSMTPYVRPEPNRSSWNTLPPPWAPFMVGSMPLGYPRFGPAEGRAAPPRADWWASTAVGATSPGRLRSPAPIANKTATAGIPYRPPGLRLWWGRCPPDMPDLGSSGPGTRRPERIGGIPSR